MIKLKQKVLIELNKVGFPNLKFLYSEDILDISLEILEELLEIDKNNFEKLIKIQKKDLVFDSFEDDSLLDYFWGLLNHYKNVNSGKKIRDIIEQFRTKIDEFGNYVAYNKEYFNLLKYVNDNLKLDEEQKRIMYLRLKSFKDRGIDLDKQKQSKLKEINIELSKLSQKFGDNIVDDDAQFEYLIDDFELIKNLPLDVLDLVKERALEKGKKGYLFDADPTNYQAIMKYCESSKIRQDFEISNNLTSSSGKYDNRLIILKILKLKQEKAKILGYNNYAELSLNSKMAESPKQIIDLVEGITKKSQIKAKQEIEELKNYFSLEKINSYDLSYYSRKYKEEKYDLDEKELKKYFEFNNSINYLFNFVSDFYQIELKKINIKSYNNDIIIYEIYKNGKLISYYLLDPFYNKNKRSGAWADNLREKTYLGKNEKIPIVVNVCNFQKTNGDITLSMRDVETIFHEFGHALHLILSESKYSELDGFGVEWDFVELPSQIMENWVKERESLEKLSKHYKTGKPLTVELLNKLDDLRTYMSGNFIVRQNEFILVDMNIYLMSIPNTINELDEKILNFVNQYSLFKRDIDYKMYCSFGHIFGGGYAAGYYSYTWAEIIEADVFERIKEMGMFDKKVGEKFIKSILGQGTRKKASELFFDFMGREVCDKAFLKRKGLY